MKKIEWVGILLLILLLFPVSFVAQNNPVNITGRVTDEKGELMIGVTIMEKGTSNGAMTDENGTYNIKLSSKNAVLAATFLGYDPQEKKVSGTVADFILKETVSVLNEVQVVGYGVQRRVSIVGAQSTLKMEQVKAPVSNISNILAGRVSGLVAVQRTGVPGKDDSDIWIRGISSMTNTNQGPLVLVDGIERDYKQLDPEDIASVTVLKDASSTAVYGVRGGNGVIIITTKPGVVSPPKFTFDYYEGITKLTKIPKLVDGYQYMDATNEAYQNTYGTNYYSDKYIEYTKMANGLLPNDGSNPTINKYLYPNVDWMDALYKKLGRNRRANVNIRGGAPNASYYVSLSYYEEKGLTRTDPKQSYSTEISYDRYNFLSNITLKATKKTTIDIGVNGYFSSGTYPYVNLDDIFSKAMNINPVMYPVEYPDGKNPGFSNVQHELDNPYGQLTKRGYKNEYKTQVNSNLKLSQELDFWSWSEGLKAHALIAFDVRDEQYINYKIGTDYGNTTWKPSGTQTDGVWNGDVMDANGNIKLEEVYVGNSTMSVGSTRNSYRTVYAEGALNYNRTFNRQHNVTGLLLASMRNYRDPNSDDTYKVLPYKQLGISGRLTYSYDDRYFGELNAGYTGSENFSPDKRMGFFPAVAIGWVPSNEKFWKGVSGIIPFLKIRYSNGVVGNDVLDSSVRFGYNTGISGQDGYTIYGNSGTVGNGIGISKYGYQARWSTIHKQDLGLEVNFLKNELSFVFDLFKERRSHIYVLRNNLPLYAGFARTPAGNIGEVENKGFEASFNYNKQINPNLYVSLQGNLTMNEDKVIEDGKTVYKQSWRNSVGQNVLARFGYIAEGLYTSEQEIIERGITQFGETYPGQLTKPGDIKYKDLSGDKHIDEQDMTKIGRGDVPKTYYGFGGDIRYKNWGLGILFQGMAGADRALNGSGIYPFVSSSGGGTLYANINDRWSSGNPANQNVFYPRLAWSSADASNSNNFQTSTWWQKDMSFLRLKQFTISYYFPKSWAKNSFINGGRFYAMGSNVFTWSKFKLWDPELNTNNGISYPNTSAYTIGVNFDF